MNDPLALMGHRLRAAIASGAVKPTDRLENCPNLDKIMDASDSLDTVELVMALEEKAIAKIRTIDDRMRELDKIRPDPN
jgi:hypothetical protein